jgi:DNA-binding IclR family transcriptional regulator
VGLVLLAHADRELQETVIAGPLKSFTRHTLTDGELLRRVLADIRRDGYAISDRAIEEISLSVAAPVFAADDTVVAALSTVVPAGGQDPRTLVPMVKAAARGISRVLGAPSATGLPKSVRRTSIPWNANRPG